MKKERLKEILILIKNFIAIREYSYNYTGICKIITTLHGLEKISYEELYYIKNYISNNRPTPNNEYKEFTKNQYWINTETGYWWEKMYMDCETVQIRIDYLTALINNVK